MGKHPFFANIGGALVGLHIVALLVLASPSTQGIRLRSAWSDATVQDEFRAWTGALRGLGFPLGPDSLEDALWSTAHDYARVRWRAARLFEPYAQCCGARQSWRMFSAPHRHPSRLVIEVEQGGRWERVYLARSSERRWRARQLDHVRMRKLVFVSAWPQGRLTYQSLVRWIAARASEDFQDATRLRVFFLKGRSPTPAELRGGEQPALAERKSRIVSLRHGRSP